MSHSITFFRYGRHGDDDKVYYVMTPEEDGPIGTVFKNPDGKWTAVLGLRDKTEGFRTRRAAGEFLRDNFVPPQPLPQKPDGMSRFLG